MFHNMPVTLSQIYVETEEYKLNTKLLAAATISLSYGKPCIYENLRRTSIGLLMVGP